MEVYEIGDRLKLAILQRPSQERCEVFKYNNDGSLTDPRFEGTYSECRRFISRYTAQLDSEEKSL